MATSSGWSKAAVLALLGIPGDAGAQGPPPAPGCELALVVQSSPLPPPHHSPELFLHAVDEVVIDVPPGQVGEASIAVGIVSDLPRGSVQGWQVSIAMEGDIVLRSVTAEGTVAPYQLVQVVDPALIHPQTGRPQGEGVICVSPGVGLRSFIPRRGTATILRMEFGAASPQGESEISGTITWRDNLSANDNLIDNVAIVRGESHLFCPKRRGARLRFLPLLPGFLRGDANGDGRFDLADAVWTIRHLFYGGPPPPCAEAADADADGRIGLGDALAGLQHILRHGPPLPPPFPACAPLSGDEVAGCLEPPPCGRR
jgi:hypothetical protein